MRCKKLRRSYFKYLDGRLSKRRSELVDGHIRCCPECAAEVESLKRMRSLLRTAGKTEMPDTYWDTYWDRLEKKLPAEPPQVGLVARTLGTAADLLRQPAVLGRIAVYAFLLAFVIYITPERLVHESPKPSIRTEAYLKIPEGETTARSASKLELHSTAPSDRQAIGVEKEIASADRPLYFDERAQASRAEPGGRASDIGAESTVEEVKAAEMGRIPHASVKVEPSSTELLEQEGLGAKGTEVFAGTMPKKPAAAPQISLEKAQDDLLDVVKNEDEYVAAENYFQEGKYIRAISAYQNFVTANVIANVDNDQTLKAMYQIGESYYQMGNYSEALSNFAVVADAEAAGEAGLKKDLGSPSARKKKDGTATLKRADYQWQARSRDKEAMKVVAGRGSDAKSKTERARGGVEIAERAAQEVKDSQETRQQLVSQAVFRLAESYERLGKKEEALASYKEYMKRFPQGEYLSQARDKITKMAR